MKETGPRKAAANLGEKRINIGDREGNARRETTRNYDNIGNRILSLTKIVFYT